MVGSIIKRFLYVGLGFGPMIFGACKQAIAPQGPYLIIEPLGAVFAGSDSASVLTYSNPVRIRMSDWSRFPLAVVSLDGDSNAFVFSLDTRDTTFHTLTFIPTQDAFTHPPRDNVAVITLTVAV